MPNLPATFRDPSKLVNSPRDNHHGTFTDALHGAGPDIAVTDGHTAVLRQRVGVTMKAQSRRDFPAHGAKPAAPGRFGTAGLSKVSAFATAPRRLIPDGSARETRQSRFG